MEVESSISRSKTESLLGGFEVFKPGETAFIRCKISPVDKKNPETKFYLEFGISQEHRAKAVSIKGPTGPEIVLQISNLTFEDNNWIFCRISRTSSFESGPQTPLMTFKPLLVEGPPVLAWLHLDAVAGTSKRMCRYDLVSYPPSNISWLVTNKDKHIHEVHDSENHEYSITNHPVTPHQFWRQRGVLSLQAMHFLQGNYTLLACNSFGCVKHICSAFWSEQTYPINSKTYYYNPPISTTGMPRIVEAYKWLWPLILFLMIFFVVAVIILLTRKFGRSKHCAHNVPHASSGVFPNSEMMPLQTLNENMAYSGSGLLNFPPEVPLIATDSLAIIQELGEGAFGKVYLAECKDWSITKGAELNFDSGVKQVAAKKLKVYNQERLDNLRIEASNLARLKHPNIVCFFGVCLTSENDCTVYLLFEFMKLGSLRSYLLDRNVLLQSGSSSIGTGSSRGDCTIESVSSQGSSAALIRNKRLSTTSARSIEKSSLSEKEMLNICFQISKGLAYLSDNHFIHRDLAARNCLVSEGSVIKISDFGMSRDIYCENYYKLEGHRLLPVRWLAPEALLYGKFCTSSDVWSLAVVFWEVYTMGKQPWYAFGNHEVIEMVKEGKSLTTPDGCPVHVADIMRKCWSFLPDDRPTAGDIAAWLHELLSMV